MSNVNVVNRICCFFPYNFSWSGLGVALATLATPWVARLRPCHSTICGLWLAGGAPLAFNLDEGD